MSELQVVTYRGRLVAVAIPTHFFLADRIARLPVGHPQLCFVVFMCFYARDVLTGELPGPYRDSDARVFARAALIPGELLERPELDIPRAAAALGLPARELRAARREAQGAT